VREGEIVLLRLICLADEEIYVKREKFHAAVSTMLPEIYHNEGLKSINKRKIKAHSITLPNKKTLPAREPFTIDIKGLDLILDHIKNHLKQQPYYYISNITVKVLDVQEYQPKLSDQFRTFSPVVLIVPQNSPFSKYAVPNDDQKTLFLTPEENRLAWEAYAANRLYAKAVYLFGDVPDKPSIKIESYKIERPVIYNYVLRATDGLITIFGDPFWREVAFNFGLGDKTTYGLGSLITLGRVWEGQ
jgi:CRISPR-associated endoribonuclease Cas6